ncbi:hypothetical protein P7C70_g6938, partial [Phenoliferia sp. Uapishka_3]
MRAVSFHPRASKIPSRRPATHVLRLHLAYDGEQPTVRLRHKVFSAKLITWQDVKEMVDSGTPELERRRVEWMYSRKALKYAADVQAAPTSWERCAVISESFVGTSCVSTNIKVFAIDLSAASSPADSTWLLDLQRTILEPEPKSFDEILTRRVDQHSRIRSDTAEASRLSSQILTFNALPRITRTPSQSFPDHYHFDIFHVSIPPEGDILYLVNPGSTYTHVEARLYATGRPIEQQARIIAPALIKAFSDGLGRGKRMGEGGYPPTAPWQWSTLNASLAQALSKELERIGVRPELCKVGVSKPDDAQLLREGYEDLMGTVMNSLDFGAEARNQQMYR